MKQAEAKELGLKVYTPDKPLTCHPGGKRRTSNRNCHQCKIERNIRIAREQRSKKKAQRGSRGRSR